MTRTDPSTRKRMMNSSTMKQCAPHVALRAVREDQSEGDCSRVPDTDTPITADQVYNSPWPGFSAAHFRNFSGGCGAPGKCIGVASE